MFLNNHVVTCGEKYIHSFFFLFMKNHMKLERLLMFLNNHAITCGEKSIHFFFLVHEKPYEIGRDY